MSAVQVAKRELPAAHARRFTVLVGSACRHADPDVARMAWTVYPRLARSAPQVLGHIADAVSDLGTLTMWRTAMDALISLLDEGFTPDRLQPVFDRLLGSDVDGVDGPDAEADRDRPAAQRLAALAHSLISWMQRQHRRGDQPAVHAIGELLSCRPAHLPTGLALMAWSMPIDERLTDRLDRLAALVADRALALGQYTRVK